ncbi:MAG: hypothetical protein JW928_04920 [Candidatus Aureabacteria bacterium]|nr:hypothetical protein [Candidatus Auribacterota bacterium]
MTKDIPIYNAIFGKFLSQIKGSHPDVEIKKFIVAENNDTTERDLLAFSPQLIFSVGTKATFVSKNIPGVPKIYTMVVNPIGEGFCSKEGDPMDDMTGVLITVSPREQFELLKKIMPDAQRIGVVYDPGKSSLTVNSGVKVGDKMGLVIGNIPVSDPAKVPDKIESLKGKIDVLWGVVDDTVYNKNSMEFILLFSFRNKIPLIGFSPNQVKAGALFAMYCDYPVLGTQAGDVAAQILNGKNVMDVPLQDPADVQYSISSRAAKLMGLKIPPDVESKAEKVFD